MRIGLAACRNCHTSPPEWNVYGLAVKAEMQEVGARQLTVAVLQAIEGGDADQDGWLNGDEIRAGYLPGDSESHPDGRPGDAVEPVTGTTGPIGGNVAPTPVPAASPPVVPLHSFHPAVVHFPVALFLFGGPVLHGFSFALVVGIIIGTYSSVFIASPIVLFWNNFFEKFS